jgi:dihydropteroate synthase
MIPRPAGLPATLAGLDRTAVIGVLNVTPDSFSDGGRFLEERLAVEHGLRMFDDGADLVDIGGESTRPGAQRIPAEEELARVLPVVEGLAAVGVPVSIDTMRSETARAAVAAGACMVNDVSGGLADVGMYAAMAEMDVPVVLMHWRGHSVHMTELASYDDVVADVVAELGARVESALAAGVSADMIVLDPGMGFPLLVGASRKRFLGSVLADGSGASRPVDQRDAATDAVTAIAAVQGVWAVRVHDVRRSSDAVRVAAAWRTGSENG